MLGLLALMISFTFAMALTRFDARRDAVLNEANAIGTTALRARLLPSPHSSDCLALLRDYVKVRLDITRRVPSNAELNEAISRSNAIQEALWQQAKAMAAKDSGLVPTGLFIQSLNDMIDNHEKRLTAARNRVPNIALVALYAIAAIAIAFTGYAGAAEPRRWRPGVLYNRHSHCGHDPPDPGHRQTGRRLRQSEPTADDRCGRQPRQLSRLKGERVHFRGQRPSPRGPLAARRGMLRGASRSARPCVRARAAAPRPGCPTRRAVPGRIRWTAGCVGPPRRRRSRPRQ